MRFRIALGLAFVLTLLLPIPSAAGGGSVLDFDRFAYEPGDIAVAQGTFGRGCCGRRGPKDGPFYAYAYPTSKEPLCGDPCVPEGAVRLGSIEVTGEGPPWLGRLEFVVPDLAPGTYGIWHCNDPCETGLGDVVFWEMHVVESDGEGRLWSKLDALEQKSRAWKYRNSIDLRRVERRLGRQIKELEARVTQLEARPVAHRKVERSGTVPWAVAVMALGIAGAVAGVLARKRKLRLDTTQTRS